MDPIAPATSKDAAEQSTCTDRLGPRSTDFNFFTSKDECDKFVKDEGITPQQASDIN
jgi:hypothetical protein